MACSDTWTRKGGRTVSITVTGDQSVGLISLARTRFDRCTGRTRTRNFSRAQLAAGVDWALRNCTRDELRLAIEPSGASVDVVIDIDDERLVDDTCTRGADPVVGRWNIVVICPGGRVAFCQGGGQSG